MKKKKGFTLVELIVVIAILAVILLLVVPNIVDMFNNGKKDSFIRQVQAVWREAEKDYTVNYATGRRSYVFSDKNTAVGKELSINKSTINYVAGLDIHGDVTFIAVGNKEFCYLSDSASKIDIKREEIVEEKLVCNSTSCTCGSQTASVPEDNSPIESGTPSGGSSSGGSSSGTSSGGGSSSSSNKVTVQVICKNCTASPSAIKTINKGEVTQFQIYPDPGYVLDNATVTGACVLVNGALKTGNVQANVSCTVNVTERAFTVSFNANGGSEENLPKNRTILYSESPYEIPYGNTNRFGHSFAGWATSPSGEVEYQPYD